MGHQQSIILRQDWWVQDVPESIDLELPGIYEWRIGGSHLYIGQSLRLRARIREYPNNVHKLLTGQPYRRGSPDSYRAIHHELRKAYETMVAISVTVLENCNRSDLNRRERYWIAVRKAAVETGGPHVLNGC